MSPILEVAGLHRQFGGLVAVQDVSFAVMPGAIAGLMGPNGAGKTTVFNLISGVIPPQRGSARLLGEDITGWPPYRVVARGLVRTFQSVRLFPDMTATENVMAALAARAPRGLAARIPGLPSERRTRRADEAQARALLQRVGVVERQDVLARKLGLLDRHLVEIARALATRPKVLLLDEPSTGMISSEVALLETLIRSLRQEHVTVLIVEHNVGLMMRLCDEITVMDFGRVIARGTPSEIAQDPAVIAAYLGGVSDAAA
jgi:ABC-type branched-subunit amino acid transport system ATPase component